MAQILWGNWFYDAEKKSFTNQGDHLDKNETRGFCKFFVKPIMNLSKAIDENDHELIKKVAKKQGFLDTIKEQDLQAKGNELTRKVFRKWIDVADAVLDMCCENLPSPKEAQKSRMPRIYNYHIQSEEEEEEKKVDPADYEVV